MDNQNKQFQIVLKQGLKADLENLYNVKTARRGELFYCTDTEEVFIANADGGDGVEFVPVYVVTEDDVTQHQEALSITESQISDLAVVNLTGDQSVAGEKTFTDDVYFDGGLNFGDGDTGLFEYVDDRLQLDLGGSQYLRMEAAGNIQLCNFAGSGHIRNLEKIRTTNSGAGTLILETGDIRINSGANSKVNIKGKNTSQIPLTLEQFSGGTEQVMRVINDNGDETFGITTTGFTQNLGTNGIERFSYERVVHPSSIDGDGVGINLRTENASGVMADVAYIDAVFDDISSDNTSLIFSTRNSATPTEAMRIDAGGNVGVGTSDPEEKLHVAGDVYIDGESLYINSPTKKWEITVDDSGNLTTTEVI